MVYSFHLKRHTQILKIAFAKIKTRTFSALIFKNTNRPFTLERLSLNLTVRDNRRELYARRGFLFFSRPVLMALTTILCTTVILAVTRHMTIL